MKMSKIKEYRFVIAMISGIVLGCIVGAAFPDKAESLSFLGKIFTNAMMCMVVPMVFFSVVDAIASVKSVGRAGKMLFVTLSTFVVTALIASIIMYIACHMISLVSEQYMSIEGEVDEGIAATELIVNFFT